MTHSHHPPCPSSTLPPPHPPAPKLLYTITTTTTPGCTPPLPSPNHRYLSTFCRILLILALRFSMQSNTRKLFFIKDILYQNKWNLNILNMRVKFKFLLHVVNSSLAMLLLVIISDKKKIYTFLGK